MTFAQKLALAKTVRLVLVIAIAAFVGGFLHQASYHYCHGSNHNARGYYCEAAYADEEGYRALK